jgi:arsenate reductase
LIKIRKVYLLKTCDIYQRILKEGPIASFELQEIKFTPINTAQLEEIYQLSGSYKALFNKRARQYKTLDLKSRHVFEGEYKQCHLDEYTFLKRPVFIVDEEIFIGNSAKVIEALKIALS